MRFNGNEQHVRNGDTRFFDPIRLAETILNTAFNALEIPDLDLRFALLVASLPAPWMTPLIY